MDLSTLSTVDLREMLQKIPGELKRRESKEKAEFLSEVRAFARARGYAIEELLDREVKTRASSGAKVRVKYRHPQDATLEWTGRGRRPKWVDAWLAGGGSLDNLLV